ncbi:asparagine synthase-related protein [Parerythrobacter aurantius]|uniref:asparagine synthase-related protein n=1 Tax=Parerythrobacter aurantius TaxID=3127706 RepID=UPI00324645C2
MLAAISGGGGSACEALRGWIASHGLAADGKPVDDAHIFGAPERGGLSGRTVFDGWIDNAAELSQRLALDTDDPARLYDAAVARWGDRADRNIVGQYAAVTALGNGALRLARSPINAPPLHWARIGEILVAASLPSAFFSLGLPKRLDWDVLADLLAMDMGEAQLPPQFEGILRLPLGSICRVSVAGASVDRWYLAQPLPSIADADDAAVLARLEQLLAEACRAALRSAQRPALALSAGLDSPTVADELLRQLPQDRGLNAVTFVPESEGASDAMPGAMADEWSAVERFAAMHPRLAVHRADPAHGGFDYRFRDVARQAACFNPSLAHFGSHHGVWETASSLGCDWLFGADLGNQTFSADGRWAYAEDFRRMRWDRMLQNLRGRVHDHRPLWRKVLALGVMPNLPLGWRRRIKGWVRPSRRDVLAWNSLLSPSARAQYRVRAGIRGSAPAWEGFAFAASRAEAARRDLVDQDREHGEITLALELRYGMRYRDVTSYRPLVEYCMALPTRMFVRDGEHRYLARRLAQGRMPESQRLSTRFGRHGPDWHSRMKPRLGELLAYVDAVEGHPRLAALLDTGRMRSMLEEFPAGDSADEFDNLPYAQGLARALLAAQFVGVVEGRNDL